MTTTPNLFIAILEQAIYTKNALHGAPSQFQACCTKQQLQECPVLRSKKTPTTCVCLLAKWQLPQNSGMWSRYIQTLLTGRDFIYLLLSTLAKEPKPLLAEDPLIIAKVRLSEEESNDTDMVYRYNYYKPLFISPPPAFFFYIFHLTIHTSSWHQPPPPPTHRSNWVVHMGIQYTQAHYVLVGWQDDLPMFGRIQYIVAINGNVLFGVFVYRS